MELQCMLMRRSQLLAKPHSFCSLMISVNYLRNIKGVNLFCNKLKMAILINFFNF